MMKLELNTARARFIAGAAAAYFALGSLWILMSDQLMVGFGTSEEARFISSNRGLVFVFLSTCLLAVLLLRVPPSSGSDHRGMGTGTGTILFLFAFLVSMILAITAGTYRARETAVLKEAQEALRAELGKRVVTTARWLESKRRDELNRRRDPLLLHTILHRQMNANLPESSPVSRWASAQREAAQLISLSVLDTEGRLIAGDVPTLSEKHLQEAFWRTRSSERSEMVNVRYDSALHEHNASWLSPVIDQSSMPARTVGYLLSEAPIEELMADVTGLVRLGDGALTLYLSLTTADGRLEPFARGVTGTAPAENSALGILDPRAILDIRALRDQRVVVHGTGDDRFMAVTSDVPGLPLAFIAASRERDWLLELRSRYYFIGVMATAILGLGMVLTMYLWRRHRADQLGPMTDHEAALLEIDRHRRESDDQVQHMGAHDPITGLHNRYDLRDELLQALNRSRDTSATGALILMSLDRFDDVNAGLGHVQGDEVLVLTAYRIRNSIRPSDFLARSGTHQFALIVENVDQMESVARLCSNLISSISHPMRLEDTQLARLSASVGVALINNEVDKHDRIIDQATAALHQAQRDGGGVYRFHLPELTARLRRRLDLEARIIPALDRGEFSVHYQPLLDMRTRRVIGCEALLRWTPQGGSSISPSEFIPIAEHSGLIIPLGDWVLEQACSDMARWRSEGLNLEMLAVNLSTKQLALEDIAERVDRALRKANLDPRHLELEITESALAGDVEATVLKLHQLKRLGVHLAIDDFGTGYSSLTYLKRFPVDKLKIDQGFVRGIPGDSRDGEIVTAITAMAQAMRLKVLAEGIERREQMEFLTRVGCHNGQGYLFSPALPASEFAEWVTGQMQPNLEVA